MNHKVVRMYLMLEKRLNKLGLSHFRKETLWERESREVFSRTMNYFDDNYGGDFELTVQL